MGINSLTIEGRLTRDATLKTTKNGTAVLTFSLAYSERVRDASGEWGEYSNYIDCEMYGNRAEAIAQYMTKGLRVFAEGFLHHSRWESKDGESRSKHVLKIRDISLPPKSERSDQPKPQQTEAQASAYADEDIPF